jgi:hypothetical protein
MVSPIAEGRRYAIDSAQGTPFIDFLGFHFVLKRTVLPTNLPHSVLFLDVVVHIAGKQVWTPKCTLSR